MTSAVGDEDGLDAELVDALKGDFGFWDRDRTDGYCAVDAGGVSCVFGEEGRRGGLLEGEGEV